MNYVIYLIRKLFIWNLSNEFTTSCIFFKKNYFNINKILYSNPTSFLPLLIKQISFHKPFRNHHICGWKGKKSSFFILETYCNKIIWMERIVEYSLYIILLSSPRCMYWFYISRVAIVLQNFFSFSLYTILYVHFTLFDECVTEISTREKNLIESNYHSCRNKELLTLHPPKLTYFSVLLPRLIQVAVVVSN